MNPEQILNEMPITVESRGEIFDLNLYGTLYQDGNYAILAVMTTGEVFTDITTNVPDERMLGNIETDEIVLNHDIVQRLTIGGMRPILEFLTDKPARTVTYGMAFSIAIYPRPEVLSKLEEIANAIYSGDLS